MPVPATATLFEVPLDPHEELDFEPLLDAVLEAGETAVTYELNLLPEAVALGLTIMEGGDRDHALIDGATAIRAWFTIDDAFKTNAAFDAGGITLPFEVKIVTSSTPPRTRNRTWLIRVVQQ